MRWLLRLVAAHDTTAQAICPLLQHLPLHCDNVIASKSTNLSTCQLAFVKRSRKRTNVNGWSYVRGQVPCKREMSVTSRKNSRISTAASSDSLCELVVLAIQLPHGNALHKGKVMFGHQFFHQIYLHLYTSSRPSNFKPYLGARNPYLYETGTSDMLDKRKAAALGLKQVYLVFWNRSSGLLSSRSCVSALTSRRQIFRYKRCFFA